MEITEKQKQELDKIVKKSDLSFVMVFGSQVKGKTHKNSDLDVGVLKEKKLSLETFGKLFNAFSDVFKGYNLDLRFINEAEPVFLYEAFKNSKFLAGDEQKFFNYKAFAYKNFVDCYPLFQLKERLLRKKQKELNYE